MSDYIINFIIWYYRVLVKNFWDDKVVLRFTFLLNKANVISMAQNLRTPLFRDNSSMGRQISFIVRFFWIGFGTLSSIILLVPNVLLGLGLVILPLIPIVQVINFLTLQLA